MAMAMGLLSLAWPPEAKGWGVKGCSIKAVSATKRPSMRPTSAKMSKRRVKATKSGARPAGHFAAEWCVFPNPSKNVGVGLGP